MTRSPLSYPLNRALDGDAGGLSDLQTDVMRFMAILALCLVAIFALVQSIPLEPRSEITPTGEPVVESQTTPPAVAPPGPAPESDAGREIELVRPEPRTVSPKAPSPVLKRPRAEEIKTSKVPPVREKREGFTLRFEDEVALTRLVARNEVGLYAILPDKTYRMNVNRDQMSFWPASMPKRFHEMDEATVPDAVVDAFLRSSASRKKMLKWGVTIPSATSRQVEKYLQEAKGGDLIIDAAGELRLER